MFSDSFATAYFDALVERHGIRSVVETGTFEGESAREFRKRVAKVVTIENSDTYYAKVVASLGEAGIDAIFGDSAKVVRELRELPERCCFFLDAHWGPEWPILAEFEGIAHLVGEGHLVEIPVILVHDFKVPERPELGYDSYGGQDLDWDYVKSRALAICPDYVVSFNEEADGRRRGILRLEPPAR